jgi:hypothetical protein
MKQTTLRLMLALTLCAGLSFAQGGKRMAERLGLSEDQKVQVEAILKEQREASKALRQKTHDRLSTVLNADQMQKLEKGQRKMHQRRARQQPRG